MPRTWVSAVLAGALTLPAAAAAERPAGARPPAERLPIRVYTADDGLAGDEVNVILQDSRGFLWVGTGSGLGSRFVSYDPRQGLPSPNVGALLEDSNGGLLVGTTGGLARLDPSPAVAVRPFQPAPEGAGRLRGNVAALQAEGGAVWAAVSTLLLRRPADRRDRQSPRRRRPHPQARLAQGAGLLARRAGLTRGAPAAQATAGQTNEVA